MNYVCLMEMLYRLSVIMNEIFLKVYIHFRTREKEKLDVQVSRIKNGVYGGIDIILNYLLQIVALMSVLRSLEDALTYIYKELCS